MGLFSKIGEMIRKIRTPRLEAGNNYQENQYQDTRNMNYLQQPYTITLSNNGEELMITSIQFNNKVKHHNGEVTNLMIAKACCYQDGRIIYYNQQESIAFELPEGAPIDNVILQKIGQYYMYERNMPDNNKDCMYIGKLSQDPYDLGTNNKSEAVKRYINETVAPQIAGEKQEQIERQLESYRERQERENIKQREFVNRIKEEQKEYERQQNQIKIERMENPYLKQISKEYITKDGKRYCDYNGINVNNGDFLRLRKMNKVGKDENGTYIYTGYVNTTQNEHDAERLTKDGIPSGIPVCFATDKKIEEIMQSNNPNDLRTLLSLLSEKSEDFINNNGYLNYIGKIDKDNRIDKNLGNTTRTIQSAVGQLQQEFYQEKTQKQQKEQNEMEY